MEEEIYDAEFDAAMKALDEEITAECKKMQEAIAYVKENIDYPFERIEEYLKDGRNNHIGYVQVEEHLLLDEMYYKVVGEEKFSPFLHRQDDNGVDTFTALYTKKKYLMICIVGICYSH